MNNMEEYLNQIPMWAVKKNSLEDIRSYLEELGNPDGTMQIIHVAGTNGKGSVCAFMTSVLSEAGYQVMTFVSPHLEEVRERFLMNGVPVPMKDCETAFEMVRGLSGTMTQRGYAPPTYFEFLFYMFIVMAAERKPDVVILETGLGGRLDSTNVILKPVLTILTSISLDHMEYLGDTVAKIAWEKAGILKPGVPIVYDDSVPEASDVIRRKADELGCPVYPVGEPDDTLCVSSEADYQRMNAAVAARGLDVLCEHGICRIDREDIRTGIRHSRWPGRMEEILPGVYADGAHNIGGIEALAQTMKRLQQKEGRRIHLLFAVVSDKEHEHMIQRLCRTVPMASITVAAMTNERGAGADLLVREFRMYLDCPVEDFAGVEEAFHHLLSVKEDGDLAFCAGSLYLIGEIKQILRRKKND